MRWLPIFLLLLLVGCPTDNSPSGGKVVASHPWELEGSEYPFPEPVGGWGNKPGHPQIPKSTQPPIPETDYDPSLLSGSWFMLARSDPDGVTRAELETMPQIDFTPNGKLVFHRFVDGEDIPTNGTWEKTSPGVMVFELGGKNADHFMFQMHGTDFFYFASGTHPQGYWYAKIPEVFTDTIMANRFQTNRGELHLADIVGNSFSGTVSGGTPMEFTGIYNAGVLLLNWVEPDSGNNGLAALKVAPDWSHFDGVWWINNFEAAPFGGEWTGSAGLPEDQPEV